MSFKILICDDSSLIRKNFKEFIGQCDCVKVIEALDATSAIAMYKEYQPNLVFLDFDLPTQAGINVLFEIKSFDPNARVIMLSSSVTQANLEKSIKAGACDFMQKPWEQSQLSSIIARYIIEGDY